MKNKPAQRPLKMKKMMAWTMVLFFCQTAFAGSMEDYCGETSVKRGMTLSACVQAEKDAKAEIAALKVDAALLQYCESIVGESWVLVRVCLKKEAEHQKPEK
jgi:hypothetical protein